MTARKPREALDVVRGLEDALVALERSFAALETNASAQQRETGSGPDTSASPQRGNVERGVPDVRADRPAPLTPEEHRRLKTHLEALLEEVRQLADFLASHDADPDPPKPG